MSSTPSPVLPRNRATCVPFQVRDPRTAPTFEEAYQLVLAAEAVRTRQSAPGYRVYWVSTEGFGSRDLGAGSSDFMVVGRHTLCDVVLEGNASVALRHLLLRATCLDDGCPRLSVLDLCTHEGFALADESRHRSMKVVGAVALRVGAHVLIALPSGEPLPRELPEPVQVHPYRQPARTFGQTMLSLLAPPMSVTDSRALGGPGTYAVTLQGQRGHATAFVTGLDLARGLLVGRAAPRAHLGYLARALARVARPRALRVRRLRSRIHPGRVPERPAPASRQAPRDGLATPPRHGGLRRTVLASRVISSSRPLPRALSAERRDLRVRERPARAPRAARLRT